MNATCTVLACPWCQRVPDVKDERNFRLTDGQKYGALVCCAAGPEVRTDYKPVAHWRDSAIAAWNEREGEPLEVSVQVKRIIDALTPFADAYQAEAIRRASAPPDTMTSEFLAFLDRNTITPSMTMGHFRCAHEAVNGATLRESMRNEDMSQLGRLRIIEQRDGDIIVTVQREEDGVVQPGDAVEFCAVGAGGGRSPKTLAALRALMGAIDEDNMARPIRTQLAG